MDKIVSFETTVTLTNNRWNGSVIVFSQVYLQTKAPLYTMCVFDSDSVDEEISKGAQIPYSKWRAHIF